MSTPALIILCVCIARVVACVLFGLSWFMYIAISSLRSRKLELDAAMAHFEKKASQVRNENLLFYSQVLSDMAKIERRFTESLDKDSTAQLRQAALELGVNLVKHEANVKARLAQYEQGSPTPDADPRPDPQRLTDEELDTLMVALYGDGPTAEHEDAALAAWLTSQNQDGLTDPEGAGDQSMT